MQNVPTARQTAQAKMFELMRQTALSNRAAAKPHCALSDKDADRLKSRALASLGVRSKTSRTASHRFGRSVINRVTQMRLRKTQRRPALQSRYQ
ncbi:hypothetical protein Z950_239 [Sulfitobacter mediterraneus KCTC 32188]|nr:hypothetical protein Z950_239 [Sulfitobacter mediterraneus KCTC 32188]